MTTPTMVSLSGTAITISQTGKVFTVGTTFPDMDIQDLRGIVLTAHEKGFLNTWLPRVRTEEEVLRGDFSVLTEVPGEILNHLEAVPWKGIWPACGSHTELAILWAFACWNHKYHAWTQPSAQAKSFSVEPETFFHCPLLCGRSFTPKDVPASLNAQQYVLWLIAHLAEYHASDLSLLNHYLKPTKKGKLEDMVPSTVKAELPPKSLQKRFVVQKIKTEETNQVRCKACGHDEIVVLDEDELTASCTKCGYTDDLQNFDPKFQQKKTKRQEKAVTLYAPKNDSEEPPTVLGQKLKGALVRPNNLTSPVQDGSAGDVRKSVKQVVKTPKKEKTPKEPKKTAVVEIVF